MNKEFFVEFAHRVTETHKHLAKMEDLFGGIDLSGSDIASLLNFSERLAWRIIGFKEPLSDEEYSLYNVFVSYFWSMVCQGSFSFSEVDAMNNCSTTIIRTWENFYTYWKEILINYDT